MMMNNKVVSPAELVLLELGIDDPSDIDVESIAMYKNAVVQYKDIEGSEARLVSFGEKSIISVDKNASINRARFSIAHELGHLHYHGGEIFSCIIDDLGPTKKKDYKEKTADEYAAQLLMPNFLFSKQVNKISELTIQNIKEIGSVFKTSFTATAIRLVELEEWPSILIMINKHGEREWFRRSSLIPERWFPKEFIGNQSAYPILFKSQIQLYEDNIVSAEVYFDRKEASDFRVSEEILKITDNYALMLINFTDEEMFEEF